MVVVGVGDKRRLNTFEENTVRLFSKENMKFFGIFTYSMLFLTITLYAHHFLLKTDAALSSREKFLFESIRKPSTEEPIILPKYQTR
jgi:hypothetical protein